MGRVNRAGYSRNASGHHGRGAREPTERRFSAQRPQHPQRRRRRGVRALGPEQLVPQQGWREATTRGPDRGDPAARAQQEVQLEVAQGLAAILKMLPPRVNGVPCPVGELNLSAHARYAPQLYLRGKIPKSETPGSDRRNLPKRSERAAYKARNICGVLASRRAGQIRPFFVEI